MEGMQGNALSTNRNPFEAHRNLIKQNRPVNVGWPVGGRYCTANKALEAVTRLQSVIVQSQSGMQHLCD